MSVRFAVRWMIGVLLLTTACSNIPFLRPAPTPTPAPTLESALATASDFLSAWERWDYEGMYDLLSPSAKETISRERFVTRYRNIAQEATITAVKTQRGSGQVDGETATVAFRVLMETQLVGQIVLDNSLHLSWRDWHWDVDWTPAAIFPTLSGDNLVHLFRNTPARGSIYDRDGLPLATLGKKLAIGVVPGQIEDEARLVNELGRIFRLTPDQVRAKYASAGRPDWFMPVGELWPEQYVAERAVLDGLAGVAVRELDVRIYPNGSLAGQVIGYLGEIQPDDLSVLEPRGYRAGDIVGAAGLERSAEEYLAGGHGATLAIISPEGQIVNIIAQRQATPSSSVYTTLDTKLQRAAEAALAGRNGAIVALDPQTGDVLAMASSPGYDPGNLTAGLTAEQWAALLNDPNHPLLNRATLGLYPLGSTFKIVTMAAGMEELGLTADSHYYCAGQWELGDGWPRACWIWAEAHTGHGDINLFNGLVHSCNTVFWEVGKALDAHDPTALPRMARAFGLGATTGIQWLEEATGLVPDPAWVDANTPRSWAVSDAVNLAIGQGYLQVTPLQAANLIAAVANGGTLYTPRLVRRIVSPTGGEQIFEPQVIRQLPVSPGNLEVIRQALVAVAQRGTARNTLAGFTVSTAGKTGTAEAPPGATHAWFLGYAPAENPQIAVAVVVEHGGQGNLVAAPIFRQVLEAFFGM